MSEFVIEKGVEIPRADSKVGLANSQRSHRRRSVKYPFQSMECGDSFFVPLSDEPVSRLQTVVFVAASHHVERYGGKFLTRGVDGGVRIWRVA